MDLPLYFIVGERPVKLVSTPEGGMDCQVFHWRTGAFTRDLSYISRCIGPVPSEEADEVDELTFQRKVAELRRRGLQPLWFADWQDALTLALQKHASGTWAEWTPSPDPAWKLAAWNDPRHQGRAIIPMSSHTSYVERYVTLFWDRGLLHFTQQDTKTGGGDATHDLTLPADWQEAMKKVLWPLTGAAPFF